MQTHAWYFSLQYIFIYIWRCISYLKRNYLRVYTTQCALPIYRGLFSPNNSRKTPITRPKVRYGCLSWVPSLIEVLPSNLLFCAQYRVILLRDISRVYVQIWYTRRISLLFNFRLDRFALKKTAGTKVILPSLNTESCHDANFVVTRGTVGYQNGNLRCHQRR